MFESPVLVRSIRSNAASSHSPVRRIPPGTLIRWSSAAIPGVVFITTTQRFHLYTVKITTSSAGTGIESLKIQDVKSFGSVDIRESVNNTIVLYGRLDEMQKIVTSL